MRKKRRGQDVVPAARQDAACSASTGALARSGRRAAAGLLAMVLVVVCGRRGPVRHARPGAGGLRHRSQRRRVVHDHDRGGP